MSTRSKILLGVLGAAAAGLVVGLLIAPDKGSETRKRIRRKANGWASSLSDLFSDAKGELEEVKSKSKNGRSAAEDKVNKLKENLS